MWLARFLGRCPRLVSSAPLGRMDSCIDRVRLSEETMCYCEVANMRWIPFRRLQRTSWIKQKFEGMSSEFSSNAPDRRNAQFELLEFTRKRLRLVLTSCTA